MNDETVTDALLREFLLGKVTDEVRERIEGLFLTDPATHERVLAVEQDLIEDYLEGTLSGDDRELFVARYAQTAEQRRKLRISKSIKDWATTEAKSAQTVPVQVPRSAPIWRRAFFVPIAAAVLIAIVIAAFWLSRRAPRSGIEEELAQLNAPSNQQSAPVALELSPVMVRGGESQNLNSQAQTGFLVVRLLWIQKEGYPHYRPTIHRLDETRSYAVPDLQPDSDGKSIRLKLPTHILINGIYQITLTGIAADGSKGLTEEYTFNVGG